MPVANPRDTCRGTCSSFRLGICCPCGRLPFNLLGVLPGAHGRLVLIIALGFTYLAWRDRPDFSYEGPDGTVAAGEQVTVRDPDSTCGPLIVSIWEPSVLGQ